MLNSAVAQLCEWFVRKFSHESCSWLASTESAWIKGEADLGGDDALKGDDPRDPMLLRFRFYPCRKYLILLTRRHYSLAPLTPPSLQVSSRQCSGRQPEDAIVFFHFKVKYFEEQCRTDRSILSTLMLRLIAHNDLLFLNEPFSSWTQFPPAHPLLPSFGSGFGG